MTVVYLGIGSNLGDKESNCMSAVERLSAMEIYVIKQSALYETTPWGVADQPDFLNMAVEAETTMFPQELLAALKEIEIEMGRKAGARWGPRLIDLDLLLYGDRIVSDENLVIPHPLLHKRDFVLLPLSEIAPEVVHPVLRKTIMQLKEMLFNETDHISQQQIED